MRGTIRPRGPGRHQIQVYIGRHPTTGRRRFRARTITGTRRDAEEALAHLVLEVSATRTNPGDDPTFDELVARWISHRSHDWSPKTLIETRGVLERHATPTLGPVLVRRIRPADLDALYAERRTAGIGTPTVAALHRKIRAALNQAVRWDLIATNPALRASPPREQPTERQPPDPDQMARLLDLAADDAQLYAYIRVAATTGHRRGEVCALRWEDLDRDAGAITFARALARSDDGWILKDTKTGRRSTLAVDAATFAALDRWRLQLAELGLVAGERSPWVFPAINDLAAPCPPEVMTRRWIRLRRQADLEHVRLHDLRHFVATHGLGGGHDVRTVGGRLGHADASQTLRRYGHRIPARDQALAEYLGQLIDGAG